MMGVFEVEYAKKNLARARSETRGATTARGRGTRTRAAEIAL